MHIFADLVIKFNFYTVAMPLRINVQIEIFKTAKMYKYAHSE